MGALFRGKLSRQRSTDSSQNLGTGEADGTATIVAGGVAEGHFLSLQAGVLLWLLAGVAASAIHLVTQVNHKVVERLKRSLDLVRKGYVEHVQSTMSFGGRNNSVQDVQVGEAVFDETLIPIEKADGMSKTVEWERWVGLVQRGKPTSFILLPLSPKHPFCK